MLQPTTTTEVDLFLAGQTCVVSMCMYILVRGNWRMPPLVNQAHQNGKERDTEGETLALYRNEESTPITSQQSVSFV